MDLPGEDMLEMFRALTRLRRAWHPVRPAPEMNKSHFTTLMAIAHAGDENHPDYVPVKMVDGGLAVGDLSQLIQQSLPVISQRIRALEELGYVERFNDDADRRVYRVKLTQSGKKEVEQAHLAMKRRMDIAMQHFGKENIPALISMLNKLAYAFEQTSVPDEEIVKEKKI